MLEGLTVAGRSSNVGICGGFLETADQRKAARPRQSVDEGIREVTMSSSSGGYARPQITGDWTPADGTAHRLEVAETEKNGILAMRNNYDPDNILFVTPKQVLSIRGATSEKGSLAHLVTFR